MSKEKRTEFDRQLETRDRAIEHVNSVFYWAIKDQITHSQILDKLSAQVYTEDYKKRLTISQKEYVRGYVTCRFDDLYRNHIAWGFKPLGIFCAKFDEVLEKYHDEVVKDKCNGFHYWKASNGNRPYSGQQQTETQSVVTTLSTGE